MALEVRVANFSDMYGSTCISALQPRTWRAVRSCIVRQPDGSTRPGRTCRSLQGPGAEIGLTRRPRESLQMLRAVHRGAIGHCLIGISAACVAAHRPCSSTVRLLQPGCLYCHFPRLPIAGTH